MGKYWLVRNWIKTNPNKVYAWAIGLGFVLFVIHNPAQPLLEYVFLPVVGLLLSFFGCVMVLMPKWGKRTNLGGGLYWRKPIWEFDLGKKWVYIPLLIIVLSMAVSGFVNGATLGNKVAPLLFGVYLFGVYLASRKLGKEVFKPFAVCVIIQAISCVVYGIMYPGARAGGLIAWTSAGATGGIYAISVRFLVFGAIVSIFKRRRLIILIALIGLFFTGSEEAVIAVVALGVAMLIRRDWSKKLLIPVAGLVIFLAVATPLGITQKLGEPFIWYGEAMIQIPQAETAEERDILLDEALNNRWTPYKNAINNISPVGHGYYVTWSTEGERFSGGLPHNVPLMIMDQVGPIAHRFEAMSRKDRVGVIPETSVQFRQFSRHCIVDT